MLVPTTPENEQKVLSKSGKYRIFIYGTLQGNHAKVTCDGDIRVLPDGYAAVRFDRDGIVHGEVMYVDQHELGELDKREENGKPHYERVIVRMNDGLYAYSYQFKDHVFQGKTFKTLPKVKGGHWNFKYLESGHH